MKQEITITIKTAWLLFDIMNDTFLRGRTLKNRDNYKEIASMLATEDEENQEKILRSLKHGIAILKGALEEYLDEGCNDADNGRFILQESIVIKLNMPRNFNESVTGSIAECSHDYLKNKVVTDWYMLTNKPEVDQYNALAENALAEVKNLVGKRKRPTRPTE